ncbi:threonylcarbamoyl-AMP synthase [Halalkalibacillus sediminis]|uniref:Threonylcarbamoyl-AMP synthase n=1 Tax=Halalkalibacillus sediminis TaxID=2018042 RepID=A0A2I0QTR7_9BACI|nr:L-threonylcarbamoyladenylate synthase [Halalkalibacillus sediminis]PKR77733.1 threonylcarbamoyl-AMP synthase [Halalkalibacillus sediminis]
MSEPRETKVWQVNQHEHLMHDPKIKEAANWLRNGKLVAFPTETVYGLGADATDERAVAQIFEAKGRPADNPLIVHIGHRQTIGDYVKKVPDHATKLMDEFWPGPLTIILEAEKEFADNVTAGLDTVGIRMPNNSHALALLQVSRIPVAAPSANRSGKPSPTTADHVYDDLNGRIDGIVDGGRTGVGLESTVIDCTSDVPVILRPGGVTREDIESVLGEVEVAHEEDEKPKSPGMKYKHYAPDSPVWLVEGGVEKMRKTYEDLRAEGQTVGLMISQELADELGVDSELILGSRENVTDLTGHLYDTLRKVDTMAVDVVLAESFSREGIGEALMNRLERAATKII